MSFLLPPPSGMMETDRQHAKELTIATYLRLRKLAESATHVEYELQDTPDAPDAGPGAPTLTIEKATAESRCETEPNTRRRRALVLATRAYLDTGEWPEQLVRQS